MMTTYLPKHYIVIFAAVALWVIPSENAFAWKHFQDQWQKVYLDEHPDEDFAKMCRKKAKCFVCHQGKKKSQNNVYGDLFVGKLTKKDRKDKEKIIQAIKEVGLMPSDPNDDQSPTFDAIIAEGKLPGGDLKDLKKDPEGGKSE